MLFDFYEQGEINPLVIIREYKTYWHFMEAVEKNNYSSKLDAHEKLILEYLSKTILSGVRPNELYILQKLLTEQTISADEIQKELKVQVQTNTLTEQNRKSTNPQKFFKDILQVRYAEYQKYKEIGILQYDKDKLIHVYSSYIHCLEHREFNVQIRDIINVGLARYRDKYASGKAEETPFVLYERSFQKRCQPP